MFQSLEANYTSRRKAKVQEQHKAFQALLQVGSEASGHDERHATRRLRTICGFILGMLLRDQRQQVELKRVKAGLELPKRVVVMADTIRKLRLQRANKVRTPCSLVCISRGTKGACS